MTRAKLLAQRAEALNIIKRCKTTLRMIEEDLEKLDELERPKKKTVPA